MVCDGGGTSRLRQRAPQGRTSTADAVCRSGALTGECGGPRWSVVAPALRSSAWSAACRAWTGRTFGGRSGNAAPCAPVGSGGDLVVSRETSTSGRLARRCLCRVLPKRRGRSVSGCRAAPPRAAIPRGLPAVCDHDGLRRWSRAGRPRCSNMPAVVSKSGPASDRDGCRGDRRQRRRPGARSALLSAIEWTPRRPSARRHVSVQPWHARVCQRTTSLARGWPRAGFANLTRVGTAAPRRDVGRERPRPTARFVHLENGRWVRHPVVVRDDALGRVLRRLVRDPGRAKVRGSRSRGG